MALKDRLKVTGVLVSPPFGAAQYLSSLSQWSPIMRWRTGLAALIFLCLILAGCLWMEGSGQTRTAFEDGRRLLIRLDNGDIEGKMASVAPTAASAPAPPAAGKETAHSAPLDTALYPEKEAQVKLPMPLTKADNGPIKAATVPLAAINSALEEKTPDGMLPIIGSDGSKPWLYYAKPYDRTGSLPMIAVIVTGLGESKSVSESAARLPENFSLSFSPYARDISEWVKTARTAGHEAFIDLPLQPSNYPASDPGPYGLLLTRNQDDNNARLHWLMARAQGYVGFVTPQNQVYSSNTEYFKALLQSLSEHGLMLAVGHEPAKNETKQLLDASNTATITADALIDEDLSPSAIQARLTTLEQIAKTRGYAIGVAQAYPVTIQQLKDWAAKLPQQGFVLVPVTFIVHLRFS